MSARICTRIVALVCLPAALAAQSTDTSGLNRDLKRLSDVEHVAHVPPSDSVVAGPKTVAANSTWKGTLVAQGPVDVFGTVDGSAVSLGGNVVVHKGGHVLGDALAVGGRVNADSGVVGGEMRSMAALADGVPAIAAAPLLTPAQRTMNAVRMVVGFFVILFVIGAGVVLLASGNLDEVVETIEKHFAQSFWVGLLGQLLVLPALLVLVCALALTLVGILLIPFAIVAYAVAFAGVVTLGFLATSRLIGGAVRKRKSENARATALMATVLGAALFFVLWLVAAGLTWAPLAASIMRAAALAASWVAVTIGLGATLISRAGTHRRMQEGRRPLELAAWQTPTPVTGVIAAKRTAGARGAR